ncbi:ComC/BlpC family leader-containing pheromone/bacteriocin [Streptococcus ratti]|uniref:ComC/BlpC family leader-containing pheromone/bacteriocin n=1 Tax=Streptococcus ratti TaxID=1341 RepID=A0A7X9QI72_STRRT|nr:ComC/BlpC family leader-containing pheromone/bacteriocin [Streptococcus ratti]NMD49945.1 ComC/BlpC family leader-containing pheromone/bacteriocin [Streptococcus ratti]
MTSQALEQFKTMDANELAAVEGGDKFIIHLGPFGDVGYEIESEPPTKTFERGFTWPQF